MAFQPASIQDRTYQQLLDDARARIPVHNPEWTNFNQSDPGITLLQLFAFLAETLTYRANLIPERNRQKFLKLLGLPLQPAMPARGLVVFESSQATTSTPRLDADQELAAGRLPFRTLDAVDVLPVEAAVFYKAPLSDERQAEVEDLYTKLYASEGESADDLLFYETKPLEAPAAGATFDVLDLARGTADGALWVALLASPKIDPDAARQAIAQKVLSLGVLPEITAEEKLLPAGGSLTTENQPGLIVELPRLPDDGKLPESADQRVARYQSLKATATGPLLSEPGILKIQLPDADALTLWTNLEPTEEGTGDFPPTLEDEDQQKRLITWLRLRARPGPVQLQDPSDQPPPYDARLSWVGINAARVEQKARVTGELVGRGAGAPDQTLKLANTPVLQSSVNLTVNGQPWTLVDDVHTAPAEVSDQAGEDARPPQEALAFQLDRASGEIRFGDGLHGARPPADALIQVTYDYGGGTAGNLGIDSIKKGTLPDGVRVTNPILTWGGAEAETTETAEKRIPAWLRNRDRLVSTDDFEEITKGTPGVDVGRVDILPLFNPDLDSASAPGVVTVLVIPGHDPSHTDAPEPDRPFLDTVCRHLEPRRLITTELHVRGPHYIDVWVSAGLDVTPGHEFATVRDAVSDALKIHLSPLSGGNEKTGWPLSKPIERLELWAVAARVTGVAKVNELYLAKSEESPADRIEISGLELPRLAGVSVQSGDPQSLQELRGDTSAAVTAEEARKVKPVPVVPDEC